MAITLKKGQTINLEKDAYDLSRVVVGLGWDIVKQKKGFWASLFTSEEPDFDLDAIAFMLDANDRLPSFGDKLRGSDVIFYNNLRHRSGHIYHTGDNLTGGSVGDDEQIVVNLKDMSSAYSKIVFVVSIYQGHQKSQHFGKVDNAFIRAVDARGKEMFRYDLSKDPQFDGKCSMIFGELYRHEGGWKFRAIGTPYETDRFVDILATKYLAH